MSTTVVINGSLPLIGITFALTIAGAWMLIRVLRWMWDTAGIFPVSHRAVRTLRPAPAGTYNAITGDYGTGGKHRKVAAP